MKKHILILALIFALILPVCANASTAQYIIDDAGLLSDYEMQELENVAQSLSDSFKMDIVILTVDSLNGYSARSFADDFYDYNGYSEDGVLFLLAMYEREWYINTCGEAIDLLSDRELDLLGEAAVSYFSSGYYYDGFAAYLSELPSYLEEHSSVSAGGNASSVSADSSGFGGSLIISLLIGAVVAGVALLVMRSSMNTKKRQRGAYNYMKQDSYHLSVHQDLFLYSQVSKTPRQQNTNSGGGSVHRSSSGRSHGGRGGKF